MDIIFEPVIIPDTDAFSGAFITLDSYKQLLQSVDSYFGLNMLSSTRSLPCNKHSYMLIKKHIRDRPHQIWCGVGKKVSLVVHSLVYNQQYGMVCGLVHLKANFTCNKVPHIVLAKRKELNRATVHSILEADSPHTHRVNLPSPLRVHGRIGVLMGSGEESVLASRVDGVLQSHTAVSRPEITFTVEHPDPEPGVSLSADEYQRKQAARDAHIQATRISRQAAVEEEEPAKPDTMEITLNGGTAGGSSGGTGGTETNETYKGYPVQRGARGGKYIIKENGIKEYVKEKAQPKQSGSDGGPVYKVNMLV